MPQLNSSRKIGHAVTGFIYIAPPMKKPVTPKKSPNAIITRAWSPETGFIMYEVKK